MEPENKQNPIPPQTPAATASGISGLKVVQPPQSFVEEVKAAQTQQAQPETVVSGTPVSAQAVPPAPAPTTSVGDAQAGPVLAPVGSIYPEPTKGIGVTTAASKSQQTGTDAAVGGSSATLYSRVPLLRRLIFIGVIGATILVAAMLLFSKVLLNGIAFLHLITQSNSVLGLAFDCLTYGAQLLILVSLLAFLVLVLSKTPRDVNKVLDAMGSITILNGLLSLLSFNIVGVIFAVVFYRYLQSAEADVALAGLGERP